MPANRNGIYYVKRNFRGIGKIVRSLQTRNRARAVALEGALLSLHAQGRIELVRAFAGGDLGIEEISEAYETGQIPELSRGLRRQTQSLATAIQAALENKAPDVKESTLERYTYSLERFSDFAGPEASVRDVLTEETIQKFKSHRLDEGAARETINNDLGAVSILISYCLAQDWLDHRPRIRRYPSRVRIRYLESEEIDAYMTQLRPAFRPLFRLLLGTGMRLGEAEAARVRDLRIADEETRLLINDAKSLAGVRPVFVPAWVVEELREWIAANGLTASDKLFDFGRRTTQKEHSRALKAAGLADYTIHDHRHTAAVNMARSGMPLNLIQKQLGHANISQTMRYAQFNPEYADYGRYFDRIGERLGAPGHNPGHSEDQSDEARELAVA